MKKEFEEQHGNEYDPHGPEFLRRADIINRAAGLSIEEFLPKAVSIIEKHKWFLWKCQRSMLELRTCRNMVSNARIEHLKNCTKASWMLVEAKPKHIGIRHPSFTSAQFLTKYHM